MSRKSGRALHRATWVQSKPMSESTSIGSKDFERLTVHAREDRYLGRDGDGHDHHYLGHERRVVEFDGAEVVSDVDLDAHGKTVHDWIGYVAARDGWTAQAVRTPANLSAVVREGDRVELAYDSVRSDRTQWVTGTVVEADDVIKRVEIATGDDRTLRIEGRENPFSGARAGRVLTVSDDRASTIGVFETVVVEYGGLDDE